MKKYLVIIFSCIFFSCNYHCITIGNKFSNIHEIVLYGISKGGIDTVFTETHELVITNYKNNTFTAKQLYDTAKKYLDTLPNKKVVSHILFLGQEPNGCMPDLRYNDKHVADKEIIEFGFDNAFEFPKEGEAINLHDIFIFKNGDYKSYYKTDLEFDSILNSNVLLNNW